MAINRRTSNRLSRVAFAERMRELRRVEGLSQSDLSRASDVPLARIKNYEGAKSLAKREDLEALAHALGVAPEALQPIDLSGSDGNATDMRLVAQALFQLGNSFNLRPAVTADYAYVRTLDTPLSAEIAEWAERYSVYRSEIGAEDGLRGSALQGARDSYMLWKCRYGAGGGDARDDAGGSPDVEGGRSFKERFAWLKRRSGLTFTDLHGLSGIGISTLKSYASGSRLPKQGHIEALAGAFGVTWESLVFFDLGTPVRAIHALFEIAHSFELRPDAGPEGPIIRTQGPALERLIEDWNSMHARLEEYRDTDAYMWEQSTYDPARPDPAFKTRYSKHKLVRNAEGVIVARVPYSDYDPYPGNQIKA